MSDTPQTQPPGWYYAQGDPPGTQRFWDGTKWEGGPQPVPGSPQGVGAGTGPGGMTLAEPINRIAARFIDWIIVGIATLPITLILVGSAVAGFSRPSGVGFFGWFTAAVLTAAIQFGYETFMIGTRGQTLGKMLLSLKVVNQDGSAPDMQVAGMRVVYVLILGVLGAIPIVGIFTGLAEFVIVVVSLVFLFTDSVRQTIWDKMAKTLVVPA